MRPDRVLILHDDAGSCGGSEGVSRDMHKSLRTRGIDVRLMITAADYLAHSPNRPFRALPEIYNPAARTHLARAPREFSATRFTF